MDRPDVSAAVMRFLATLDPGDVVHGTVARIENFGVFVNLDDGPEPEIGYVPPPEVSWKWISSARDVVAEGQRVAGRILAVDTDFRGQAVLSLCALQPNPWTVWATRVGSLVTGRVDRNVVALGVFVELDEGIAGLLPRDEVAVAGEQARLLPGRELTVRIAEVEVPRRRIRLSLPT
ncbi:S1 RNA-binding domain-containing protein [Actinoplanes flavus]|uniref:30S ribosomal protein S1 n=1 Tax=Actinoplanes flavus TaxID=2820290 RepID=A0ABS3UT71_9ACTN|nr:S1 RNA-binding domain-containing protein [Actinoplanes flavus]MBO3741756.1 30S ribosomal protein S1 [Actinoplanes flavus]